MANIVFNDAAGKAGYISEIKLPGQASAHVIKDAAARSTINTLSSAIESIEAVTAGGVLLCGKTKTALADGETTAAVVIDGAKTIRGVEYADGASYTPVLGDAFLYGSKEFIWDGSRWNEFGDLTGLKNFAFADEGTVTLTPSGTVSVRLSYDYVELTGLLTPEGSISVELSSGEMTSTGSFTPAGSISVELSSNPGTTTTVKNPTARTVLSSITEGTLPSLTATVSDEILTLDFSAGAMPTGNSCESIATSDVTVKTGDATYVVKSQTFKGTSGQTISVTGTPNTVVKSQTFAGTSGQTISVTGTPNTVVKSQTFAGTSGQTISVTGAIATDVYSATFSGNELTATVQPKSS